MRILLIIMGLMVLTPSVFSQTRLTVNCFWPPQHFVCSKVLPEWTKEVKRVTQGRVTGVIPPKSLAPPPEQLASVETGIADVAVQFNGLIANRVTGPMVAMQPFTGTFNAESMSKALWQTNRKYFADEFKTVHLLSQWVISPGELFSQSDQPLNSMADFKSRKIWALPGPLAEISKKLGAGVVSTPAVKSSQIISRGVVDGHFGLDPQAVRAFQLVPYTKSMTKFSKAVYSTSFSFFINKDKWNTISNKDRQAIMSVSGAVLGAKAGAQWDKASAATFKSFAEVGITIVNANPAFEKELNQAAGFVTKKWLMDAKKAGIDGEAALDYYKSLIE